MPQLQKFTTEYVAPEDRIRISGQVEQGAPQVIWLTQRLMQRLVPVLTRWIEQQNPQGVSGEVGHTFAQQAARTALAPQEPVNASEGGSSRLAAAIDISRSAQAVRLTFRDQEDRSTELTLNGTQLRQWLNIVHDLYAGAGWPLDIWPDWMQSTPDPQPPNMLQ
jgi:hypothetical protein